MAPKKQGEVSKASNKVRFVMLEADLSDGNLSELTQAITHALRPASSQIRYVGSGQQKPVLGVPNPPASEVVEEEPEDNLEDDASEPTTPKPPRVARLRKTKPPEYLPELITGKNIDEFKEFAKGKAPDTKNQQYLVGAYWLKKYCNSPTVTADKIYTCYKTAGWASGFNDWSKTFHNLVQAEYMRTVGKGEFAINPTGEHLVESPKS